MVTDVYFDFGKVPVGFQSTSNPTLTVAVSGTAANGYQLVNRADAGGKYQGTLMLDSTTVKIHQHASGAKKGDTTKKPDGAGVV